MKIPLHFALLFPVVVTICCAVSQNGQNASDNLIGRSAAIKRHSLPRQRKNQKNMKRRTVSAPATIGGQHLSKYDDVFFGLYWPLQNVYSELSYATKELASEKRNPLGSCAELALRVNWLFWWNLNETATRGEQDHWSQELLKEDGLLDKIQSKNVRNPEACMNDIQAFVGWQLDQAKEGNLELDEQNEQYLRQINESIAALMGRHIPQKIFSEISHELVRSLAQKFQQEFLFYVELMDNVLLSISKKQQLKEQLAKKLAESVEMLGDTRIFVDTFFDARRIWGKAWEIEKMFELENRKMMVGKGKIPEMFGKFRAHEKASLIKNLCEELVAKFNPNIPDKTVVEEGHMSKDYMKFVSRGEMKEIAKWFALYARKWCQKVQNYEPTGQLMKELEQELQYMKEEILKNEEKNLPELALLFQLEMMERELPELALKFNRNAVRAVAKWKAGTEKERSTKKTIFANNSAQEEEDEWKLARKLFKDIFAKMAELGLNLYVNMDGRISPDKMKSLGKQKPKIADNFYWEEVLALSHLMISTYNKLELYTKAELRIRVYVENNFVSSNYFFNYDGITHFTMLVGDIEYHYTTDGLVRQRLKNSADDSKFIIETTLGKFTKTEPLTSAGMEMVDLKTVDNIYYDILHSGYWPAEGLYSGMRNCHTFIYFFVCRLFNGKCPERKLWPIWYANYEPSIGTYRDVRDKFYKKMLDVPKHVPKDFITLEEYREGLNVFRENFYQQLLDATKQAQREPNCVLQDVDFMFKVYGAERDARKNARKDVTGKELDIESLLPPLVSYTGGTMWNEARQTFVKRHGGTFVGQSEAECIAVDEEEVYDREKNYELAYLIDFYTYRATMKVFVCTDEEEGNNDIVAVVEKQKKQQPVLLENVIFYDRQLSKVVCKIKMFDLSFHAKNKDKPAFYTTPFVILDERRCVGAGTDVRSPIEELLYITIKTNHEA